MTHKIAQTDSARLNRIIRNRARSAAHERFLKRMGFDQGSLRNQSVRAIIQQG